MFLNFLPYRNVTNIINKLQIFCKPLIRNGKCKNVIPYQSFHSSPRCPLKVNNIRKSDKESNSNTLDINTNVTNNVIIYKYESNNIMLKLTFFAWTCFITTVGYSCYSPTFITTWKGAKSWIEYIKLNGGKIFYFFYALIVGPLGGMLLYLLNHRFVKYIILHKGGNKMSIITTHLYKNSYTLTRPVDEMKTVIPRNKMRNYIPLKIRDKKFFYIVDADGKFINGKLFDRTLGIGKYW